MSLPIRYFLLLSILFSQICWAAGQKVILLYPVENNESIGSLEQLLPEKYQNSQLVGRSNAQGQLVLPNILSYTNNAISLEDKDIPIEFSVDPIQRSLSPAARSGVVLVFPVVRVQSIVGTLMVRQGGIFRPLEHHSFTLPTAALSEKILTAKGGEFYVENLAVGTYRARIMIDGQECNFDLTVPKSDASLVNLEKVLACDLDR